MLIRSARFIRTAAAAAVLTVMGTSANAGVILYAHLSNANEGLLTGGVHPTYDDGTVRPASYGTATFFINDAMNAMTFTATVFNIDFTGSQSPGANEDNDNLGNAHIHASPTGSPIANSSVVWGFIGNPFNDNSPNDVVFTPFLSGIGGTVSGKWDAGEGNGTNFATQLPNILGGHAYINFHTTQFSGGEVRGQILIPEPGTLAIFGFGIFGMLGLRKRRFTPKARV